MFETAYELLFQWPRVQSKIRSEPSWFWRIRRSNWSDDRKHHPRQLLWCNSIQWHCSYQGCSWLHRWVLLHTVFAVVKYS